MPLQTSRKPNTTQQWIPQSRGVLLSSRKQRLDPGWVWYSLPVLSGTQAPLLKLFHMCPHPDGSYSLTHQVEIPASRKRMGTPPAATPTTCVYILLARTWLQRGWEMQPLFWAAMWAIRSSIQRGEQIWGNNQQCSPYELGAVGLSHTSYRNHHPSGLPRESKEIIIIIMTVITLLPCFKAEMLSFFFTAGPLVPRTAPGTGKKPSKCLLDYMLEDKYSSAEIRHWHT